MKHVLTLLALVVLGGPAVEAAPPSDPLGGGPVSRPKKFSDVGKVTLDVTPKEAKPGQTVQVKLTVTPLGNGWTYPTHPSDPDQPGKNRIKLPAPGDLIFVGKLTDPPNPGHKPHPEKPGAQMEYYPRPVTWDLTAVVSPAATAGKKTVALPGNTIQVCGSWGGDDLCFNAPRDLTPSTELTVLDAPPVPVEPQFAAEVEKVIGGRAAVPPAPQVVPPEGTKPDKLTVPSSPAARSEAGARKTPVPPDQYAAQLDTVAKSIDVTGGPTTSKRKDGLLAFLITAATWGLVSLVTPCVFPMIPITVTIFMKQGHQSRVQTMTLAAVYCLTIVVVLGVSAIALLKVFVDLSNSLWMNLFLGGLFVFFALSLFGMYDITLPNSLLKFTQTKQGAGGFVGTVFGALAFTIVSFTCVAPFLGGFAGMATSGGFSTFELVLGGLAFSTAFAAPFFLLALFPSLLKALPRSGGWLDSVKVVMGFMELAAALKFLRTAEFGLFSPPVYFTYDLVLGGWVAIAVACGLYLLNVYRLPHDEERPSIGVPRLMFAVLFLGFAAYLAPALLKGPDGKPQRPTGVAYAWVDSFLLPDPAMEFGTDLPAALERAKTPSPATGRPRPVFIDFTGVRCTNCRYNENSVFPKPQVWALMEQYERVQLYTDEVPASVFTSPPPDADRREEAGANADLKDKLFKDQSLPQYVVLLPTPDGRWAARVYGEGKINDVGAFTAFLQDGLKAEAK